VGDVVFVVGVASFYIFGEYDFFLLFVVKYVFYMMLDVIELVLDGEGGTFASFASDADFGGTDSCV